MNYPVVAIFRVRVHYLSRYTSFLRSHFFGGHDIKNWIGFSDAPDCRFFFLGVGELSGPFLLDNPPPGIVMIFIPYHFSYFGHKNSTLVGLVSTPCPNLHSIYLRDDVYLYNNQNVTFLTKKTSPSWVSVTTGKLTGVPILW